MALDILIRAGARRGHPDNLLDRAFKKHRSLTDLDRAFVTELVYGTLRWQGKIDWIIARFSNFKIERIERVILLILRLGVYQLLYLTKTPHHAAVNESVILAKKLRHREAAGFVNALLRRIIREGGPAGRIKVEGASQEILAVEQAFPLWAVKKLWNCWGEAETKAFCQASNQIAPLTLRVNTLKIERPRLMSRLRKQGLSVSPTGFSPDGILLEDSLPVSKIPLLESGYYQIQDEAAQLITDLVGPQPGENILDACAAPGTKTTHLAQRMKNRGKIYALDIDGTGLRLLRESCRKMGIRNVAALKQDATQPISLSKRMEFDAILVDAPCTGWGTIRRNPDIKWRTDHEAIDRLASLQKKILGNVATLLRKGGRMVYSTCTVYGEENEGVIDAFIEGKRHFFLDSGRFPIFLETLLDDRGFLRTMPHRHSMDGFFGARLIRR
ncbi:MAG: 16S rRNA (cytosine(967)-C(5))-methyltransferase RsmB [Proteobacteria bacterium]|nr:16S rRNA (cytosine(967)-C(5))-methyltransferase RsmB [Pseudomonadota bacterium]